MKSIGLFVLLLFCGARLLALHAGDPAAELKADFVFRGPVPLTGEAAKKNLKTLVFFRTRSAGSRELMNHLADLRERFPKTNFVAVTPDGKGEAKEFFGVYSHNAFAGAADIDFRSAKTYLTGDTVYPYAFLIGPDGVILWDGEAADLAEALEKASKGELSAALQKKLSPLQAELRSRFRRGEERMANFAAGRIFELDPANSEAIRLRLFMLRGAGRDRDAWELLEQRRQAAPKVAKLYFQQIELACAMPEYGAQALPIGYEYMKQFPANFAGDGALAWLLLERRPFDPDALRLAGQLIGRSMALRGKDAAPTLAEADFLSAAALYAYRLGKVGPAETLQKQATAILAKTVPNRIGFSQRMEHYYRSVRTMTGGK